MIQDDSMIASFEILDRVQQLELHSGVNMVDANRWLERWIRGGQAQARSALVENCHCLLADVLDDDKLVDTRFHPSHLSNPVLTSLLN